jgi:hypothetical protein
LELAINPPGKNYLKVGIYLLSPHFNVSYLSLSAKVAQEIGIDRHAPQAEVKAEWNYKTLQNAPVPKSNNEKWVTSIYRGLIPAKNIEKRDFAIAGATV